MIITKRHVSRRAVLKGMGVTVALPFLEAMAPAATPLAQTAAKGKLRFVAVEMVHGAAGSTNYGLQHNLWSPAAVGGSFDLAPTALAPLDPVREYVTIVSNTDARMAEAFTTPEIGGDHFRASSVFLTQSHPKQTMGSDLYVGTSFDQVYAKQFGQDTAIPSMQLSIEAVDHSGGCEYNYSCAYTDAISWASPSEPLPMLRDPRAVFDALFGVGATPEDRARRRREDTKASADGRFLSVRERMEQHRSNPACMSCHRVIDPIGLALENFDVVGRYRIKDNGVAVDASGTLYDGTPMEGAAGLRSALLKHKESFLMNFAENLMTYALGRRVEADDMPALRAIVRDAGRQKDQIGAFIAGVTRSAAFQMSRHAPVETAVGGRQQ